MKKFVVIASLIGLLGGVGNVWASQIVGGISFGGTLDPTLNLATTDEVRFNPLTFVTSVSGDLDSTINPGNTLVFNNFKFDPFTPNNPLWSIGGFAFALSDVVAIVQNAVSLVLLGNGTVTGVGFDPTPYAFSASTDTTGGKPPLIAFSATNTTTGSTVPEPGTLLLLGTGITFVVWGRRFKSQMA